VKDRPKKLRYFESAERRMVRVMCGVCIKGDHCECDSEACPCVCNDSDFRWARNRMTALGVIPATDPDMAAISAILRARPDLARLINA
jgi:hypothetical protein